MSAPTTAASARRRGSPARPARSRCSARCCGPACSSRCARCRSSRCPRRSRPACVTSTATCTLATPACRCSSATCARRCAVAACCSAWLVALAVGALALQLAVVPTLGMPGADVFVIVAAALMLVVFVLVSAAAAAWAPTRGWRHAVTLGSTRLTVSPVTALLTVVAVGLTALAGWQLPPLVVPALGCLCFALVVVRAPATPMTAVDGTRSTGRLSEVARLAGVSVGTVSNYFNHPERVSPEAMERVRAAIAEVGYVRNDAARQLRLGHSRSIGLIVLDVGNPFFTNVARGAEDAAEELGFTVILGNSDETADREANYLNLFERQRVRGVLVSPIADVTLRLRRPAPARHRVGARRPRGRADQLGVDRPRGRRVRRREAPARRGPPPDRVPHRAGRGAPVGRSARRCAARDRRGAGRAHRRGRAHRGDARRRACVRALDPRAA